MAEAATLERERQADEIANGVLGRAALVHRFDPFDLMPKDLGPAVEVQVLARIARSATETEWPKEDGGPEDQAKTLWRLTPEARRRALARLVREGNLDKTLKETVSDKRDIFAQLLRRALLGKLNPASIPAEHHDSAVAAANFAADALGQEKLREAEKSLRVKIAEKAEEARASGALCGKLIGHRKERAALDTFVLTGAIPVTDRLPSTEDRAIEIDAYLLTGPSGAGKSALVADLTRHWRSYQIGVSAPAPLDRWSGVARRAMAAADSFASRAVSAWERLLARTFARTPPGRIVILNLDRLASALAGEIEWTAEVTRQLGLGQPLLAQRLSDLRNRVRHDRTRLDPSGKRIGAMFAGSADLKQGLVDALDVEQATGLLLIVVLDDFEEALAQSFPVEDRLVGATLFGRLLLWADSLATLTIKTGEPVFSSVRVIATGNTMPAFEDQKLARWFKGRGDIRPVAEVEPCDLSGRRDAKRGQGEFDHSNGQAIERLRAVGPLRMAAAEVAALPAQIRTETVLSRMEFARRLGRPEPHLSMMAAGEDWNNEAAAEIAKSPDHLFAFLQEREIGTRIDYAFTFGDFGGAAMIGWRRIASISDFPDLSEPWRLAGDPAMHWIWQTALASLALDDHPDVRAKLEQFLQKFALCLDPARARADATGLVLAAAATVALGGRLSPQLVEATQTLARKASSLVTVRTFADLRLFALHPLWRQDHRPPQTQVSIPYRRLRLFSKGLASESKNLAGGESLARLMEFVEAAHRAAPLAKEVDAFASSEINILMIDLAAIRSDQREQIADILVGLSPELYDTLVTALAEADQELNASIDVAINETREQALFWPRDVVASKIPARDRDRRAGLIARAVIHADRCGLLCPLFEMASRGSGSQRLERVARLVQRYETLRKDAYAQTEGTAPKSGLP